MLPFSREELLAAVAAGDVTKRDHPTLPLSIYNYSPEIQYSNRWTMVTRACRGLILDADFNVVARPWEKFFNLGQVELPIQFDTPVEVMDKVDGSLGILYPTGNGYAIATRGSFESYQAVFATELWNEKYPHVTGPYFQMLQRFNPVTFLFEIVYPSNRIVLDYGDMKDLVLLGAVGNDTGYYIGPEGAWGMLQYPGPVVEVMPYKTLSEAIAHLDRKNAEGFVIRSHNFMVKVKQPDYLDLHRLVTNASPRTVWEKLKAGMSKTEIISAFPDEFHAYIESMIDPLLKAFDERLGEILDSYQRIMARLPGDTPRKVYAEKFVKHPDRKYFFLLLDNRSVRDVLWAELKPEGKGEGAWSEPGEDNNPWKENNGNNSTQM